jgi:3-oxoacyl-[acyl-carrier protein] reductase
MTQITLGSFAKPENISSPICFLLFEGTSCVNVQVISANGGFTIAMKGTAWSLQHGIAL